MKKWKKYSLVSFSLILIIGFIGIHFIAPYGVLKPTKHNVNLLPEDLGLKSETINIEIEEGQKIRGYWVNSKLEETLGIIILIHGIGGCKEHFLGTAKNLSEKGIASIVFDGRAHGQSDGSFCTYGFYEKEDVRKIVDFIKSKRPDLKVGIWGNSLGGAIAIQALEIDQRIEFGIIESTFTSLRQIVFDYKKRILKGFGVSFISNYVIDRAGEIAGFDPDNVQPIHAVQRIEQAMFIAHGDADNNISVEYGKQLFEKLKTKDKELVIVKDGKHFGLSETGGAEYSQKIMAFILRNF